jgi:hypothetical protein
MLVPVVAEMNFRLNLRLIQRLMLKWWRILLVRLFVGFIICIRAVTLGKDVHIPTSAVSTVAEEITRPINMVIRIMDVPLVTSQWISLSQVPDDSRVPVPALLVSDVVDIVDSEAASVCSVFCSAALVCDSEVPASPLTACLEVWREELMNDFDAEFILEGIAVGFTLIDIDSEPLSTTCENYKSTQQELKPLVEKQIIDEITKGRYIVTADPPPVISALGAIPKKADKIRLIHDFSRPLGGVNQYCSDKSVSFPTIEEALMFVKVTSYIAKIDLKEAYRSVPLSKTCFKLTGLKWCFEGESEPTYLLDARLLFGASRSCRVFQALTNSVVRMLFARNISCIGYIDDFLVVCDNLDLCASALKTVIELVESLGFTVNQDKVADTYIFSAGIYIFASCSLPQIIFFSQDIRADPYTHIKKCS